MPANVGLKLLEHLFILFGWLFFNMRGWLRAGGAPGTSTTGQSLLEILIDLM
jgi:ammonia channel protein AmtB